MGAATQDGRYTLASRIILISLVTLGCGVRIVQYGVGDSFSLDEASIAIDVTSHSAIELVTSPLEYDQVAPPLFLLLAKAASMVLPPEHALRLPAVLSAVAAMGLFALVARRALTVPSAVLAVGLFALSPILVDYGAMAKQYSGDTLAAVLLTLGVLALRASAYSTRALVVAALTGTGIVWFSQASVIVVAGLGIAMAMLAWLERDHRAAPALLKLGIVCGAAAAAAIVIARISMSADTSAFMQHHWNAGFMPFPPRSRDEALWAWTAFSDLFAEGLALWGNGGACIAVAALGAATMWRQGRRDVVLLFTGPVVMAVLASAAGQYPVSGRLSLFLLPALIAMLAAGAGWVAALISRRISALQLALPLLLLIALAPARLPTGIPDAWRRQEIRPVLSHLASQRRDGDGAYVFYGAERAMTFYAPRFGIDRQSWKPGGWHRDEPREYLRELDTLRGRSRLWLLLENDFWPGEREIITGYLGTIGVLQDSIKGPSTSLGRRTDAMLYLYDLSDSTRLAASSAETYPIQRDPGR